MKTVKKLLSWILILEMIFGMMPVNNVIAAETPFVNKVLVWTTSTLSGNWFTVIKFYNEKTKNNTISLRGHLGENSLAGVNLLWVNIPYEDFNETDITYMKAFLETGGRITFCGENNTSYATQNGYIAAAIDKLGGDMQITSVNHEPKSAVLTGSNVVSASKLTKGVTGYYYNAAAKLRYTGTVQPVFISSFDGTPHILDQAVGKGRITLITDINNWDPYKNSAVVPYPTEYDGSKNEVFFENLLLDSINNQAIVAKGGNPNIGFGPTGLTVTSSPKYTPVEDKVNLTMESTSEAGRTYYYRVIDNNTTATSIVAGTTILSDLYGWTSFTPSTPPEVTAKDGKFIEVIELDGSNKVTRSGYAGPTDDGVDKAIVTFDMNYLVNGNPVTAPSPKELDKGSKYGTYLPTSGLTRPGYTFDGWYTEDGTMVTSDDKVTATHTLYAHWTPNTYIVTFDPNDGNSTTTTKSAIFDSKYELPSPDPKREGYTFKGWFTAKTGGTKVTTSSAVDIVKDQTLYAQWTGVASTVTFDVHPGSSPDSLTKIVNYGSPYGQLPTVTPPEGKKFAGWHTDSSTETGILVTSTTPVTTTSAITLYAIFSDRQEYSMSYSGNGNTSGTEPASENHYEDDEVTVATNTGILAKTGYTFKGWSTSTTAVATYVLIEGKIVPSKLEIGESDITLYAVWEPVSVTVSFNPNGSSDTPNPTTKSATYASTYGALATVTRPGYKDLGWYTEETLPEALIWDASATNKGDTGEIDYWDTTNVAEYQVTSKTAVTNTSDHSLFAQWVAKRFKIDYKVDEEEVELDGISGATAIYDKKYGQLKSATRDGYEFGGWYTDLENDTTQVTDISTVTATTAPALYAKWTAKTDTPYTVEHYQQDLQQDEEENYGYILSEFEVRKGTTAAIIALEASEAKMYEGFSENTTHKYRVTSGAIAGDGSLSLRFYYDRNIYNVTFNSNGGTAVTEASIRYGATIAIPNPPTKQGYQLDGWYRDEALKTKWNLNTDVVTTATSLYAKWIVPSSDNDDSYTPPAKEVFDPKDGPINNDVIVLVNSKVETIGKSQESKQGTRSVTTLTADPQKLEEKVNREGNGAIVTIPVSSKSDIIVGLLDGEMVKKMEDKQATVVVKTDNASYTLPANEVDIESISKQVGSSVSLQNIKIKIEIANSTDSTNKVVESAAKNYNFETISKPFDFKVTYDSGNKSGEVERYNSYVERSITLPEGIDPNRITTGLVVEPDGFSYHVPTKVLKENDTRYKADINSLTNSTYTVVWHPLEFDDVKNHWSKASVNDMGSRMVINGVGNNNFEPDRNITRAEFAAIMVRGLGLRPGMGDKTFGDIMGNEWYADYIKTAVEYNLIKGYEDGNFKPNNNITREEAMVIISRAMKLTGLKIDYTEQELDSVYTLMPDEKDISSWAKNSIGTSVKNGVVNGKDNNRIAPKELITRAEVAAMIQRLLKKSDLI